MAGVWIEDQNRFKLAPPSAWWQQLLYDYDTQLRVLPSRKEPAYRLGRLVKRDAQLGLKAMIIHEHPDTVMMIQHNCVPVTTLAPWALRSDKVIRDLMARDTWAAGGASRVIASIEDGERRAQQRRDAKDAADLDGRAGEAWRSLKMRKGEAVSMANVARGRRGTTPDTAKTRTRVAIGDYKSVSSPRLVRIPVETPARSSPTILIVDR